MLAIMKSRMAVAVLVVALAITGCSATGEASPERTATPSATPTVKPTPKSTPTPAPEYPYVFAIECRTPEYKTVEFEDYKAVWSWSSSLVSCDGGRPKGNVMSEPQTAALTAAYGHTQLSSLGTLYSICASIHFSSYGALPGYSSSQTAELQAALSLCPDQPAVSAIQGKIDASTAADAQRASGTRFGGGIFRVGEQIQAGTYASEGNLQNCYWERLDSSGEIIDNNFLATALRAEVYIDASDFSFSSTGCGEWVRQG